MDVYGRRGQGSHRRSRPTSLGLVLLAVAAPALLLPSLLAFAVPKADARLRHTNALRPRLGEDSATLPLASGTAPAWPLTTLPSLQALPAPFSSPEGEGATEAPRDFFLFIKDYGWSLRYRVGLASESELELDQEKPLELQWVKLNKPVRSPQELLQADSQQLFNWEKMEPAKHKGFMYHVTKVFESGVEAVINFFDGKGLKLLVTPDTGIQLLLGGEAAQKAKTPTSEGDPQSVTHCWVETRGMPFLPILQSIAFYDLANKVVDLQA